jgi:hypothetical protein
MAKIVIISLLGMWRRANGEHVDYLYIAQTTACGSQFDQFIQ